MSPAERKGLLGLAGGAFFYGLLKAKAANAVGHSRTLGATALSAFEEELTFRTGFEKTVLQTGLGFAPGPASWIASSAFGLLHERGGLLTADAILGGLAYSYAYAKYGLLGSTLVHLCHNLGVQSGQREYKCG